MMVTFVSQCEKNSLKKTRRVLDAFANRIGDNTWQTVITNDGLNTVKKMLRQTASKNTAVSCFWIRSRRRSQFLWVVGNRDRFNSEGVVPVNSTSVNQQIIEEFSLNTQVIALLASIAGLFHDVGKAMALFQDKLHHNVKGISNKGYEPYCHEWVSLRIFQAFVNTRNDKAWLLALYNVDNSSENEMLKNLMTIRDSIDENPPNPFKILPPIAKLVAWLIVSHHKLPQYPNKGGDNPPSFLNMNDWLNKSFEACWNSPQCLKDDWKEGDIEHNWTFPYGTPLKSAHWQTEASILAKKILHCERLFKQNWFEQHFTSHLARLSLMLSDHYYSSKKETTPQWQDRNYHAYANTDKDEHDKKYLKQKLDEHNIAVGLNAYNIAIELPKLIKDLPALKINKAFTEKVPSDYQLDYGWQDSAYNLAKTIKDSTKEYGFFGVCQSSTGMGKTRGNARIMYGLSDECKCRFSVALGLRTLTLQTARLKEYLIKGFVLDDERLKNPDQPFDYFDELLQRIQDIRTSEKRFYQKITDIYATSVDYDPTQQLSINFFKTVQNKLHWAITGQTAAEIICQRSDSRKSNMGLTNWRGGKPRKQDVAIAKNYLNKDELSALNNLVEQYLVFAEGQAMRKITMHMQDWIKKLDGFLKLNDRNILDHAGKISHEFALQHANNEYEKFYHQRLKTESEQADKQDFEQLANQVSEQGKNHNK